MRVRRSNDGRELVERMGPQFERLLFVLLRDLGDPAAVRVAAPAPAERVSSTVTLWGGVHPPRRRRACNLSFLPLSIIRAAPRSRARAEPVHQPRTRAKPDTPTRARTSARPLPSLALALPPPGLFLQHHALAGIVAPFQHGGVGRNDVLFLAPLLLLLSTLDARGVRAELLVPLPPLVSFVEEVHECDEPGDCDARPGDGPCYDGCECPFSETRMRTSQSELECKNVRMRTHLGGQQPLRRPSNVVRVCERE